MNKLNQTARVSSGFGTAHSYPDHLLSCHWLNVLCFVSSSTSRRSPPPTSPCPAWWSSCSSSRRRCLADMSATLPSPSCQYVPYSSLPFTYTHTHGHRLYSDIVKLIGSADEVFPGLQVRRGPLSHSGCCLQVQEWSRMVGISFLMAPVLKKKIPTCL